MDRKFIKSIDINDYEVLTDTGWEDIKKFHKTIEYQKYIIKTKDFYLECADDHIVFLNNMEEIYVKNLKIGNEIYTEKGLQKVKEIIITDEYENMYDLELSENSNKRYYTNGILSHNTTTYAIFILYIMCFSKDISILVIANKLATALEILGRIRLAFELLPKWLKPGVKTWNKGMIELANGCKVEGVSTSSDAARGKSANILVLDEAAFTPPNIMNELWQSVYPIISSSKKTKCIMVSTPNGIGNLFYDSYQLGLNKADDENNVGWKSFRIDWWDVPGRDEEWKEQTLASFNGDTVRFAQEFGNSFIGSAYTLFNMKIVEKIKERILKNDIPSKEIKIRDFKYQVWEHPKNDHCYVLGVDSADGVGNDYSEICVLDITNPLNIKQVAMFSENKVSPEDFSYMIAKIGVRYNSAPIFIEANNTGKTCCSYLFNIYEYDNMASIGHNGWGIYSSSKSKINACANAKKFVDNTKILINDFGLITQMEYFEKAITANSYTYRAKGSKHDDKMMALIWALYILDNEYIEYFYDCDYIEVGVKQFPTNLRLHDFTRSVENTSKDDKIDKIYDNIANKERNLLNDFTEFNNDIPEPLNIGFYN